MPSASNPVSSDLAIGVQDVSITYRTTFERIPTFKSAIVRLGRGELTRGGHEPMRPAADTARRESRPGRGLGDPIRSGRDALMSTLDRPLDTPAAPAASATRSGGAAALIGTGPGSAFEEDTDAAKEVPAVPSLAVLRPRRTAPAATEQGTGDKPRKRLPSWDDVLFGGAPAARETS